MTCVSEPASERATTIQVPGGGWFKQGFTDVSVADYTRRINVPRIGGPQVTKLTFGAVNHRATVWVDGHQVGTTTTSYTASEFDITDFVRPGGSYDVRVRVEGRKALVGPDGRYTVPEGASWSDDVAQGIFRSADLQVFPAVRVTDTQVATSVTDRTFSYDVTLANATSKPQTVKLSGKLSSWNKEHWKYPSLHPMQVVVPAHASTTATIGPVAWKAGPGQTGSPTSPTAPATGPSCTTWTSPSDPSPEHRLHRTCVSASVRSTRSATTSSSTAAGSTSAATACRAPTTTTSTTTGVVTPTTPCLVS